MLYKVDEIWAWDERTGQKQIEEKCPVADWMSIGTGLFAASLRKLQYTFSSSPSRRCKAFLYVL